MKIRPATRDAVKLFMEGTQVLSEMENHGILIDLKYLRRQIYKTGERIKQLESELRDDEVYKIWRKRFGSKTQLGSHPQLEKVIFDDFKYERTGRITAKGGNSADESAFEFVDNPFVKKYFHCEKLKKARGTYLQGIEREIDSDGYIHPIVDLHTVITYRSSANRPNFQNVPVRNEIIGKIIRECVIAPPGFVIGEIDLSGAEVCWSVNYHKDPKMKAYVENPKSDMHRDCSKQLYQIEGDKEYWGDKLRGKKVRTEVKNKFVFPEFYGSYFLECARSLWDVIDLAQLKTPDGTPMKKHLRKKGIKSLGIAKGLVGKSASGRIETQKGTFVEHVREVEKDFWDNRFTVYKQWKRDWWQEYVDNGWYKFLTGFVASGVMDRKQVCNGGIQGSAFHHLLWSLIQLNAWLKKNKMKTRIVFEIHDSILIYFWKSEIPEVLAQANKIMTQDVREHWPCIIVPMTVEAELAPEGGSWFQKKKVDLPI